LSFDSGLRQAQPLLRMSGTEAPGPLHPPSPSAAAGPPPRPGEEWKKALAAFEAAAAKVREIEATTSGYGLEDEEAVLPAHDAACAAMEAAPSTGSGQDWGGCCCRRRTSGRLG
jgi:hypothetical protein